MMENLTASMEKMNGTVTYMGQIDLIYGNLTHNLFRYWMEWNDACLQPECSTCPNDCTQIRSRDCFNSNGNNVLTSLCESKLGKSIEIDLCGCSTDDRSPGSIEIVTEIIYNSTVVYENQCDELWYYCWWIWLIIFLIIIVSHMI